MRSGHAANSCSAKPPKRTINVASRDSRSTLRSPMCSHGAFQLIEKLWIDGIDRINQRCHGGAWRGTEESAYGILRASALHFLWSDPCAIDERLAVAFALD